MGDQSWDSIQSYIDDPNKRKKLYKQVLTVVSISQIFGGAGLAAGITVGALLAQQMLGTDAYAGVPSALITLGSAGAAYIIGRISQRYGRRTGLTVGFIVGGLGSMGVVIAAMLNNVILLFASLLMYGTGTATNLQARYAGTDLANQNNRATAVSVTLVMTTFGAAAGPFLVEIMGDFALLMGIPELAGSFILSSIAFILAGLVLFIMLRPDPLDVANRITAFQQEPEVQKHREPVNESTTNIRGLMVGASVMVLTQLVMVAIMTMTPVHMKDHGHGLPEVGMVIGFHIGFMYLPSLVTGVLVDKIGRTAMSIISGITLLLAGLIAAFAPSDSMILLVVALSLLGLGWNFGLISGTAQVVDSTEPSTRAKTQGTLDVFVALAGASGGALSGMVVANTNFATLSLIGGLLSLVLVPVVIGSCGIRQQTKAK